MNILCRIGIHWALQPLKNRAVGDLRDTKICKYCLSTKTSAGWHRYGTEEKHWDEHHIRELELGAYHSGMRRLGVPSHIADKLFDQKAEELGLKNW